LTKVWMKINIYYTSSKWSFNCNWKTVVTAVKELHVNFSKKKGRCIRFEELFEKETSEVMRGTNGEGSGGGSGGAE